MMTESIFEARNTIEMPSRVLAWIRTLASVEWHNAADEPPEEIDDYIFLTQGNSLRCLKGSYVINGHIAGLTEAVAYWAKLPGKGD